MSSGDPAGPVPGPHSPRLSREEAIARLSAPFRARRARAVGYPFAAVLFSVIAGLAVVVPLSGNPNWSVLDTVLVVGLAAALAGAVLRLVGVRATPAEDALVVRNVFLTTRVPWSSIRAVRFGGADPWLLLETGDGEPLAVMAVQRADGPHAAEEASRLSTLVELHNRPLPR